MLTIERHQQDEWCLWFSCYVHYSKIYQILEGSFRDFLDSVSAEKSEKKKQYNLHLFYLFNLLTMKHLKINGFKKILQLRRGMGVCVAFSLSAQFARAMLKSPEERRRWGQSSANPFICFNLWNPCLFIYLNAKKGIPFRRSRPVG